MLSSGKSPANDCCTKHLVSRMDEKPVKHKRLTLRSVGEDTDKGLARLEHFSAI